MKITSPNFSKWSTNVKTKEPLWHQTLHRRMTADNIGSLRINDRDRVLEVKVYRAWIHWDPPNTTEKGFRAILLDKQFNVNRDMQFKQTWKHLKLTISRIFLYLERHTACVPTENWQQTLQNRVSLSFTTSTGFDVIEDDGFPKHYFDFISYNQLPSRVIDPLDKTKKPQPVLTDYIGCYISSTNSDKIGKPNRNRSVYRKIEIQNLNRNSLELTLWGNLAKSFNKEAVDAMEKPVIIAAQKSPRRKGAKIPKALRFIRESCMSYREAFNLNPPLQIIRQAFKDKEKEKFCNRYPIAVLMAEPMEPYTDVKFTCERTISDLNTSREWFYRSCSTCSIKVDETDGIYRCRVHGPVESPANRYNFNAYITDNTHTVMMTFFTPKGNDIVGTDCDTLVKSLENPDPKDFPKEIKDIVGQKHVFQFHFNTGAKQGPHEFVFNDILDKDEQPKQIEAKPSNMATPPSTYKGMQTRSKTEAISEMNRRSAKRPLFPDEEPDNKKKKT
ncbi:nucleic acid-binding, OB-fold protein [Artemisia annua]|uniref:Nucleic acid-binding, OB-fold protein n=1 Tax=Artemisia annua TaxID=35608 RepID=A0A2U1LZ51_ARTAN|nr:nucleic acid-binding, OB-fold protein [Artemisia annua]